MISAMLKLTILYEDDLVLVIDKPAGMVVNRAQSVKEASLQDYIAQTFSFALAGNFSLRNGIVHRLDKDTSGALVVGKTELAFESLTSQFAKREVKKEYISLVHGLLVPREGQLTLPMARSKQDRERFTVDPLGKLTFTRYVVLRYFDRFSLVRVYPKTGRTHQLRVFFSHLRHPIVGDSRYLNKKVAATDRLFITRQFLHAAKLSFFHPVTREFVVVESPLAVDLEAVLKEIDG